MGSLDEDQSSDDPFKIFEYDDDKSHKSFYVIHGDIGIMWDDFYL